VAEQVCFMDKLLLETQKTNNQSQDAIGTFRVPNEGYPSEQLLPNEVHEDEMVEKLALYFVALARSSRSS